MRHKGMRVCRFLTVLAAFTVAGVALAACASPSTPQDGAAGSSGPSSSGTSPESSDGTTTPDDGKAMPGHAKQVIVTKTGGFAGVSQRVVIAEDGSWTFTNDKGADTQNGKLTATQVQSLQGLADTEGLFAPPSKSGPERHCADMFQYSLMVGDMSASTDNCGTAPNSEFGELVGLVKDATPLD